MNETEFNALAEQTMLAIEEAIEDSSGDIDYDTISDILTLEFANGSKIIINKLDLNKLPISFIYISTFFDCVLFKWSNEYFLFNITSSFTIT